MCGQAELAPLLDRGAMRRDNVKVGGGVAMEANNATRLALHLRTSRIGRESSGAVLRALPQGAKADEDLATGAARGGSSCLGPGRRCEGEAEPSGSARCLPSASPWALACAGALPSPSAYVFFVEL